MCWANLTTIQPLWQLAFAEPPAVRPLPFFSLPRRGRSTPLNTWALPPPRYPPSPPLPTPLSLPLPLSLSLYSRSVPSWQKLTADEVKVCRLVQSDQRQTILLTTVSLFFFFSFASLSQEKIFKLAKKGLKPSQIGVLLRDADGVGSSQRLTGNTILRVLKSKGNYMIHVVD